MLRRQRLSRDANPTARVGRRSGREVSERSSGVAAARTAVRAYRHPAVLSSGVADGDATSLVAAGWSRNLEDARMPTRGARWRWAKRAWPAGPGEVAHQPIARAIAHRTEHSKAAILAVVGAASSRSSSSTPPHGRLRDRGSAICKRAGAPPWSRTEVKGTAEPTRTAFRTETSGFAHDGQKSLSP
jgi:hypothetical protein